jgi:hypothetical protein
MRIAEYEFERVCDISPLRHADGSVILFAPQARYRNERNLPLHRYGAGAFCKFTISRSVRASGVYILAIGDEVRYVGECVNLSARFNAGYGNISPKNCFSGGQSTNCRLNHHVHMAIQAEETVTLWFLQTANHKSIEAKLRLALRPIWNRV